MSRLSCQAFKLQGHSINLNLRIELVGHTSESDEELTRLARMLMITNQQGTTRLPLCFCQQKNTEDGKVDSIARLKERLQLAEMNCTRLENLYQKYRLRWLEENYQDAPSPAQSEYEFEVEPEDRE
ncbi:uncharacterized protein EDB91DRAFT_1078292 [Suillus paluster]|uniref:uncharacterized protein n=1 Tax=Suillus paluster TaxID=48578 RepID=UPI001B8655D0|nr:uncharacterized protein EDB91DRAFT_1078292 [Suillus paluster]KAG1751525.1 hypothetical protein EDB91DRAFT_1078292 [Suillus paluster]